MEFSMFFQNTFLNWNQETQYLQRGCVESTFWWPTSTWAIFVSRKLYYFRSQSLTLSRHYSSQSSPVHLDLSKQWFLRKHHLPGLFAFPRCMVQICHLDRYRVVTIFEGWEKTYTLEIFTWDAKAQKESNKYLPNMATLCHFGFFRLIFWYFDRGTVAEEWINRWKLHPT